MKNPKLITLYSIAFLTTAALFVIVPQVFFLGFASFIFSVLILSLANFIKSRTKVGSNVALGIVVFLFLAITTAYWIYLAPVLSSQVSEFAEKIPDLKNRTIELINPLLPGIDLSKQLSLENIRNMAFDKGTFSKINSLVVSALSGLTSLLVIFVIGVYFALSPDKYKKIFIHLIPKDERKFTEDLMGSIYHGIQSWLLARILSMSVIGVMTIIGLYFLDLKLAVSLGVFAAAASFIPNIGPIIGFIPAAGMALLVSVQTVLYVLILFFVLQFFESYLITPTINKKVVSLPPAWTLLYQILFGALFGIIGLALAAPALVVMTILTRKIFIERMLKDDSLDSLTGS